MLNSSVIDGTKVVTATYEGGLSSEDMDSIRERLREVVADHGSASLLVEYGEVDWGRIEPEAAWKDLKSIGMLEDIERLAVVSDQEWIRTVAGGAGALAPSEVKTFTGDQRDDAVAWLTSSS